MTKEKKQPYNAEFKQQAVKLALESDEPAAKVARELGVKPSTLYTWMKQYSNRSVPTEKAEEHLYDELKRLRKENSRLKEERDILKKAAAFFAKETR